MSDRIALAEVPSLTLRQGQMTNGRRSAPVQQLECYSGCETYIPAQVVCENKGWDGRDVNWECVADDMPEGLRFGRMEVNCEGYEWPEDPEILKGSCGLVFELKVRQWSEWFWDKWPRLVGAVIGCYIGWFGNGERGGRRGGRSGRSGGGRRSRGCARTSRR